MPAGTGITARKMHRLYKGLLLEAEDMTGEDACDTTLSKFWGYPLQAHHCISCSRLNKFEGEVAPLAKKSGYDVNNGNNGIALPAYFGHQQVNEEQRHRGGHWDKYYQYVDKKLKPIYEKYKKTNPCKDKKAKKNILGALTSAENDIKSKLENKKLWLYDWSQQLYNGDYRDEGGTNMKSARKREGSSSSGLEWLENFSGRKIKRRYEFTNGKNQLREEWYTKWGYPVPGGLTS